MAFLGTPIWAFDTPAVDFALLWTLQQRKGDKGALVMFTCNHCPCVRAVQERMVRDTRELLDHGIQALPLFRCAP